MNKYTIEEFKEKLSDQFYADDVSHCDSANFVDDSFDKVAMSVSNLIINLSIEIE